MGDARVFALAALLLASAQAPAAAADPVQAPVPGGSNYNFYYLDGCYREPYQVVNSFNKAPNIIAYQLAGMRASGQSRISVGVFYHRGADTGTIMDSTGGQLSEQNKQNLTGLLTAIKQAGFVEVSIVFHATTPNAPDEWEDWQQDLYQENWQLIRAVRAIVVASGVAYRIDLGSELTASTGQSMVLRYDEQLWKDYTTEFGSADTVGFSINSNDPGQVLNVGKVYGTTPPSMFDLHMYGSEYEQFVYDDTQLRRQGFTSQPVIIGESYYDDKTTADALVRAVKDTGRPIHYLTQWPKTRANNSQCDQVDVAPPSDFSAYSAAGF
ncbi:MAG: hypothetical protein JOZ47_07290 [Kutzneria sp.]|nr:hypothetical protein [Kutzneria sp.]